jgi:hypothetical protein
MTQQINFDASEALGKYVYALRDPRNGEVFYIGKGTGNRILQHQKFADENKDIATAKLDRIRSIEEAGFKVDHLLIRTGLESDDEAFAVEQAVIDAYEAAKVPLTNLVKGHHAKESGLKTLDAFLQDHNQQLLGEVDEPIVMLLIQNKWRPHMNDSSIFECTRGHWKVGVGTRTKAKYAFGVAYGVIRGIFEIDSWQPSTAEGQEGRWQFEGKEAVTLQHLVGMRVPVTTKPGFPREKFLFLEGYPG